MAATGFVLRAYLSSKELSAIVKVTEVSKAGVANTAAARKNDSANAAKKTVAYGSGLAQA